MLTIPQLLDRSHWVFDLDGTLTLPQHDFAAIRAELGVPDRVGILEFVQSRPEPDRSRLNQRLDQIELELAHGCEPMPGAIELIQRLAEQGIALGILTRNRRLCVEVTLKRLGLERYFHAETIIASHCAEPKPAPDGLLRLMARWGCRAHDCVMIGDYLYDLQAGRAAGVAAVHFNPDNGPRWPEWTDLELSGFEPLLTALPG